MDDFQKEVYMQAIRMAIGDEKLTHFAERAGISAGNLSRIRKGQIATPEILRKIADASQEMTYDELMRAAGFSSDKLSDSAVGSFRRGTVRVPIVSELKGTKEDILNDDTLPYEEFYACSLPEGDHIYFVANDDAIVPAGSRVLVSVSQTPQSGDIVLFLLDGENVMLRRFSKNKRTDFYYGNDLTKYPMTSIKKSRVEVYGVAVQANIYFK